jgi:hypothetical protein
MSTQRISWEIVLAGLTFIGIGIYLFSQNTSSQHNTNTSVSQTESRFSKAPPISKLPGSIVIDLQNLDNLQKLENLEQLKNLEIQLDNIEQLIEQHAQNGKQPKILEESLQKLENELQKIEEADFNIKLKDQKVYIDKDYNVEQAEWTEVSPGVYIYRESFPVENLETLDFALSFGNVNVIGSDGQEGEITLRATGDMEDPARFSEKLKIHKNIASSAATFKVTSASKANVSNNVNLEATLTLPNTININVRTSGGHIKASNLVNSQQFNTSGGHISLNNIQGKTIAKTAGGHITCNQISGNNMLSTGGGHIRVTGSTGSLTAKTGGGHIKIEDASGSLDARTSGGNISASILEADGPLKFNTSAGNVSLSLPTDINADLDISGSSVSLAEAFKFNGTKNRSNAKGTINDGGLPVIVNCEYGNVNINSNQ